MNDGHKSKSMSSSQSNEDTKVLLQRAEYKLAIWCNGILACYSANDFNLLVL
jgi:hypothetical protein